MVVFLFFFFSLHNILTLLHVHIYVYDLRSTEQAMKGTAIQALGNRTFRKKKEPDSGLDLFDFEAIVHLPLYISSISQ